MVIAPQAGSSTRTETRASGPRRFHREHGGVLLLLAVALTWRLYFAVTWPIVQISDYRSYYDEALSVAALRPGTYTALNAWGPKLLYAVPLRLFGDDVRAIGVTNAVIYTASLAFLYAGVLRIYGKAGATLTLVVCLASLSEVYFNNLACTEIPGALFMAMLFWLMTYEPAPRVLAALGVVTGLAVYNRSNMILFPGLVFAYEAMQTRAFWRPMKQAAVVMAVGLATVLPLCLMNLHFFRAFSPLIANSAALWWGNNPKLSGDFHSYPPTPEDLPVGSAERRQLVEEYRSFYVNPDPAMDFSRMQPHDVSAMRTRYARGWIRRHPKRYLELIQARFMLLFWSCTYGEVPYRSYNAFTAGQPQWHRGPDRLIENARLPVRRLYRVLIALAAIGAVLILVWPGQRPPIERRALPLLIVLYYSIPFLLTAAANRYHIPVLGLCWVYVANGLVLIAHLLRSTRTLITT